MSETCDTRGESDICIYFGSKTTKGTARAQKRRQYQNGSWRYMMWKHGLNLNDSGSCSVTGFDLSICEVEYILKKRIYYFECTFHNMTRKW